MVQECPQTCIGLLCSAGTYTFAARSAFSAFRKALMETEAPVGYSCHFSVTEVPPICLPIVASNPLTGDTCKDIDTARFQPVTFDQLLPTQ